LKTGQATAIATAFPERSAEIANNLPCASLADSRHHGSRFRGCGRLVATQTCDAPSDQGDAPGCRLTSQGQVGAREKKQTPKARLASPRAPAQAATSPAVDLATLPADFRAAKQAIDLVRPAQVSRSSRNRTVYWLSVVEATAASKH